MKAKQAHKDGAPAVRSTALLGRVDLISGLPVLRAGDSSLSVLNIPREEIDPSLPIPQEQDRTVPVLLATPGGIEQRLATLVTRYDSLYLADATPNHRIWRKRYLIEQ